MPRTVLIVDDHREFRRRARQLLEAEGYQAIGEGSTGADGVEAARRLDPDLVLLDVHLPDGLGFDLVEDLAGERGARKVILISTHDEDAYRSRAIASGAAGFITKDELSCEAIERLLA